MKAIDLSSNPELFTKSKALCPSSLHGQATIGLCSDLEEITA